MERSSSSRSSGIAEPAEQARTGRRERAQTERRERAQMEIRVEPHGAHVAIITIDNQPRRNAMSRQMMADLVRVWEELERSSCRCIVLTGAGDRAFSAGADLSGDL